jgi:hypothetical protein
MMDELDAGGGDEAVPAVFICPISGAHAGSGDALHGADVRAAQHLPLAGAGPPDLPHHHAGALERRAHPQRHPPPAHRRHARFRKRSADVHGRAARLVHALRGRQQPLKGRAAAHQSVAKAGGVTLLASLLGPFTSHAVGSEAVAILVGGVLAGLQLLNSICAAHSTARTMIVSIGAVAQLLATECVEPGPWTVLDALSAVPEGRAALKDCPRTIPNAVRLLMRVSEPCTRRALSMLWLLCRMAPEECAPAAKLLLVIQSGCAPGLKQEASELLNCAGSTTPTPSSSPNASSPGRSNKYCCCDVS